VPAHPDWPEVRALEQVCCFVVNTQINRGLCHWLQDIRMEDEGRYYCVAENKFGHESVNGLLLVRSMNFAWLFWTSYMFSVKYYFEVSIICCRYISFFWARISHAYYVCTGCIMAPTSMLSYLLIYWLYYLLWVLVTLPINVESCTPLICLHCLFFLGLR